MSKFLSAIGEFGLINHLKKNLHNHHGVIKSIGDDAAVISYTREQYLLFTTDMMAEDVHFTRTMLPRLIGHKALACNISDIAAMGGLPTYAVVSIGLPSNLSVRFVDEIYQGMSVLADQFNVSIVGGDTIASNKIVINVALLGEVEKKYLITRDGAKNGDWIFVTGQLGRSFQTKKHLTFTPRVAEARFLVKEFKPNAMIDISDGLAGDLNHILEQSKVSAVLYEQQIPRSRVETTGRSSLREVLSDGEDFELLFTLPAAKAHRLVQWQSDKRRWYFYHVGEIVGKQKGLRLVDGQGRARKLSAKGFTHF